MVLAVAINVIDHSQQRYETCGDWTFEGDLLHICVSDTGDWKMNMLVAFHELAESLLCKARGISEEAVTAFDVKFEDDRKEFGDFGIDEPGDYPDAPYRREHFFAMTVERLLAAELGVDWIEYEDRIAAL